MHALDPIAIPVKHSISTTMSNFDFISYLSLTLCLCSLTELNDTLPTKFSGPALKKHFLCYCAQQPHRLTIFWLSFPYSVNDEKYIKIQKNAQHSSISTFWAKFLILWIMLPIGSIISLKVYIQDQKNITIHIYNTSA